MADINLTAEQVAALILSIGDKSKLKTAEKKTLVDAINNLIDSNLAPTSVLYTPMDISDESKAQARKNISSEMEFYRIPLSYDSETGQWSTEVTPRDVANAYQKGMKIYASVDLNPISTITDEKIFIAEEIRYTRGTATGRFVSGNTVLVFSAAPGQDFVITEEIKASSMIIRGTVEDDVFIPETDYTAKEIYDAFNAGAEPKVIANGLIARLIYSDEYTAIFSAFDVINPADILGGYSFLRVGRSGAGWGAVYIEV